MIYYKIRKKSDPELYLKGTPEYHRYDSSGRIFTSLGRLRSFITSVLNSHSDYARRDLGDWEVVELEMQLKGTKDLHMVVKPERLMQVLKGR